MLQQPLIEKLLALRLTAMADALKVQEQDPNAKELSFLERLGLLVDQQWTWRENQALARRLKGAKLRGNVCLEDIDYRAMRDFRQERDPGADKRTRLGGTARKYFCAGPHRHWEKLHCFGVGAQSLPRRILCLLHACGHVCSAISRWHEPMAASALCWHV